MNAGMQRGQGEHLIEEVRATIAEVSVRSVFVLSLVRLRQPPGDGYDWYRRTPFVPLLIMKWAAELWSPNEERRHLGCDEYVALGRTIWDANGDLIRPDPSKSASGR